MMKKIKATLVLSLSALLIVGLSSFAFSNSTNKGPTWVKKSCPNGMAGYICVWQGGSNTCPDPLAPPGNPPNHVKKYYNCTEK